MRPLSHNKTRVNSKTMSGEFLQQPLYIIQVEIIIYFTITSWRCMMSNSTDDKSKIWPKYMPYTSLAMGMIQPEWLFMSHFFDDEEEPDLIPVDTSSLTVQPVSISRPTIQIHFRPRSQTD
jgi:hypothetical protein